MRDHVRLLIDRARHGTDARRVRGNEEAVGTMEALASDAVRLARVAAAIHGTEAARHLADPIGPLRHADAAREPLTSGERTR